MKTKTNPIKLAFKSESELGKALDQLTALNIKPKDILSPYPTHKNYLENHKDEYGIPLVINAVVIVMLCAFTIWNIVILHPMVMGNKPMYSFMNTAPVVFEMLILSCILLVTVKFNRQLKGACSNRFPEAWVLSHYFAAFFECSDLELEQIKHKLKLEGVEGELVTAQPERLHEKARVI